MILITAIQNGFTIKIDNNLAQARPPVYEITKSGGDSAVSLAIKNVYTGEILADGFRINQIQIDGESFNNFEDLSTAAVGVLFKKGGGSGGGGTDDLTLEQARQNGNVLEGDIEIKGEDTYNIVNIFQKTIYGDYQYIQFDSDGPNFIIGSINNTNNKFSAISFTNGIEFQTNYSKINITHSDPNNFQGIVGNEEFNKQGDRKAFAQLSDVYDNMVDVFEEITKAQLDTHIANSTLKTGVLYGITETERWMLLGDSTDTLYLRAISNNQLEPKGIGKFFVPKYDKSIDGYGIWKGEIYEAFPTTVPEPTYAINDTVIWGGRLWKNLTGLLGTKIDIYTLSADWEIVPFDEVNYNIRYDKIEYDYQNDMIIYRKDDNGNEISTSYQDWLSKENSEFDGNTLDISLWNSLKIYQWGNEFDYNLYKGTGFNIITNSILQCINSCGNIYSNTLNNNGSINSNTLNSGAIHYNTLNNYGNINSNSLNNGNINSNTLENNGNISSNTLNNGNISSNTLNNGYISSNTLKNSGSISSNTLENNGYIQSNTLNNGYIQSNTLNNYARIRVGLLYPITNKSIRLLIINNGDIGGSSGIDLSTATLVYADYTREVFRNSEGVTKIKYTNGAGATVVANLTD